MQMGRTDDGDGQSHLHGGHLLSNPHERDDDGGRDGSLGTSEGGQFGYFHPESISLI
jgi:hypothetical protein